ncbi:MAG: DUF4056 domain-containing protein [Phycisphaerales bacterium]
MQDSSNKGRNIKVRLVILFSFMFLCLCGCTGASRPRWGYLPTATLGNPFADPNKLGNHSSGMGLFMEAAGCVYTCNGGHIDLDHIRGNADITKYLYGRIHESLTDNEHKFKFNLTGEMSEHIITLTYPEDWAHQENKEQIIDKIAIDTAPYIALNATTWHEIMTWFGVHFLGFEPEFNSAFSWEDIYSNLVGVKLGVASMKDKKHSFDQAMTINICQALKELGVRPRKVAIEASKSVAGKWYTGMFIPDMKMRNFDIGSDGSITPILIPNVSGCENCWPATLEMPDTSTLEKYGFTMTHQIKPNVFEEKKILQAAETDAIFPEKHFPVLVEFMKNQARDKGYSFAE